MKLMNPTPGPFILKKTVTPYGDAIMIQPEDRARGPIAIVLYNAGPGADPEQTEANARVLGCAIELHEAFQHICGAAVTCGASEAFSQILSRLYLIGEAQTKEIQS